LDESFDVFDNFDTFPIGLEIFDKFLEISEFLLFDVLGTTGLAKCPDVGYIGGDHWEDSLEELVGEGMVRLVEYVDTGNLGIKLMITKTEGI